MENKDNLAQEKPLIEMFTAYCFNISQIAFASSVIAPAATIYNDTSPIVVDHATRMMYCGMGVAIISLIIAVLIKRK